MMVMMKVMIVMPTVIIIMIITMNHIYVQYVLLHGRAHSVWMCDCTCVWTQPARVRRFLLLLLTSRACKSHQILLVKREKHIRWKKRRVIVIETVWEYCYYAHFIYHWHKSTKPNPFSNKCGNEITSNVLKYNKMYNHIRTMWLLKFNRN